MAKIKKKKRKLLYFILLITLGMATWFAYDTKQEVDEINKWDQQIAEATEKYNISEYNELVLGIIYAETRGQELDVMQSSESKYGEQAQIGSSSESIDSGVQFLAEAIKKARQENCDVWTAVQAYNFGLAYIDYVKDRGGKNTLELSEEYSRSVLAPMLGNTTEQRYRYWNPRAIAYNGGYLYTNGGNFFYAELVQFNIKVLDFFA